jgi:ABC-type spermidine/putrescine transport system permease subunit I
MIRWLRRLHTFLGVFFSPLLLLFVVTGWWQTVTVNRNKGLGFGTTWIERLSTIHVDNYFPLAGAHNYSTDLFKALVVIMAIGLVVTTLLGLVMAFRFAKGKASLVIILVAGILVPILLLYLGEGAKRDLRSPEAPPSVRPP